MGWRFSIELGLGRAARCGVDGVSCDCSAAP
jgi:hypothetical protein